MRRGARKDDRKCRACLVDSTARTRVLCRGMAKEFVNLSVRKEAKRAARIAAMDRDLSLSEFTELAWREAIEAERPAETVPA